MICSGHDFRSEEKRLWSSQPWVSCSRNKSRFTARLKWMLLAIITRHCLHRPHSRRTRRFCHRIDMIITSRCIQCVTEAKRDLLLFPLLVAPPQGVLRNKNGLARKMNVSSALMRVQMQIVPLITIQYTCWFHRVNVVGHFLSAETQSEKNKR